jgi:hypothetical protein
MLRDIGESAAGKLGRDSEKVTLQTKDHIGLL